MYLKALEIQGFKSFPEKTRLTFDRDITAIVGPNGSGKSNIADALLWVMGEQRTKALRGGKMEDVIFGGTERRGAMGFAQVSLILDNSGRLFDTESTEVMLTRRYYRSGESEYYLNRQPVRLKDITGLLMDTGLGRDGYSVIGQGRIAEIVSAKSTDRREIFEEAAGIARYRHRKEEAERKLQHTEENLLRVNDKIDELEMQVGPLREQAETAKKYLLLRDELRILEISLWMENLDRLREQARAVRLDCESLSAELKQAKADLDELYARSENLAAGMRDQDLEAEKLREAVSRTEASQAESDSAAAVLRANLKNDFDGMERLRREIEEQKDRARGLDAQMEERRVRIAAIDRERASLAEQMLELQRRGDENAAGMDEAQRALHGLIEKEGAKSAALAESRTTLSMLADNVQELYDRDAAGASEFAAAEEKHRAAQERLLADEKEFQEAEAQVTGLQNAFAGRQMLLAGREKKAEDCRERQTRLTIDLRATDDRIALLTELEKDYEGFNKAVKSVMREAERGALRGVRGPVAKLLQTEERFALAIETALGGAMQNIVVDTQEVGKAAIEHLKNRDAGRATFLPLNTVKGGALRRIPKDEPGFLGVAADLVRHEERYEPVFMNLLGRTVITETLGDAVRMAKKYENAFRIVSLDGQVINAGGAMTGGSAGSQAGILSRANELRRLRERRETLAAEASRAASAASEAARELEALRYELETARAELEEARGERHRRESNVSQGRQLVSAAAEALENSKNERAAVKTRLSDSEARMERTRAEIDSLTAELESIRTERVSLTQGRESFEEENARLSEERSALRAADASLEAERAAVLGAIEQFTGLMRELDGDSSQRRSAMTELERRMAEAEEALRERETRLAELRSQTETLREQLAGTTARRLELEGRRTAADKAAQEKNRELLEMEHRSASLEQKRLAADMEEKQIIDKLWDTYELSRSAAQAARRPVESVPQSTRRAAELRRDMAGLGTPNLGAVEEYKRVSDRYEFLTEQRDDVEKARGELSKIIAEITKEMKEIFLREFHSIDQRFRETFLELFGGGRAALELEDESDVLSCGVEIHVQPPGKALSAISLLSGGEKAFVAIALYFAMMKVRPTPFCVMDEIESALDEANVLRFADYMRAMSLKTQFVVITHRRGTMEQADLLYGVTMQEKGVSSVLSVDMPQAMAAIAKAK